MDAKQLEGDVVALTVTLIVKAEDVAIAKRHTLRHLNDWVTQPPLSAPFPTGTLLYYSFGTGHDAMAELDDVVSMRAAS